MLKQSLLIDECAGPREVLLDYQSNKLHNIS